ncbi:MAG TPA: aspartyl protease family protein [Pyrinomonadaceae bacterium]|nr:aspartyl protease family protein [Pyrinomonadaceae bacterium]
MGCLIYKHLVRRLAVGILAAIAICLIIESPVQSAAIKDDKSQNRADKALRDGDFEAAEKIYRDLLTKDPHDNRARLGLSLALLKQRQLQGAYDHAARVILVEPLSARAHALLGSAILASGDFRNSVEEFRTAISIQENESVAVAGLAMVDFYENRLDSAIRGLRRAVSIAPNEPDYIFNLGQAAARGERYREAADAYERFLIVAPKTDADRRARIRGLIDFLRYLGRQSSLYVPAGSSRTTVPFESIDGRPILSVRVNGEKEPLRFVLDTGSGMSVISDETAKRLGLRPVARGGLARAVGGGGRFEIIYGFLSSLQIGEVKVENVPVYIRRFFDAKTPVDGYIGLSIISKFIASVDYGENNFTLVRRQSDNLDQWRTLYRADTPPGTNSSAQVSGSVEIPLRTTSSGFLSGEVRLDGIERPLNFIIDTGASISVVSEKLAALEEMASYLQPTRMRVFGAAGIAEDVKTLMLPKVMLGTFAREQISAAVLDLDPVNETAGFIQNGILGGNFLRHFRVLFDFQRGLIRLEPLNKTARKTVSQEEM